MKKIMRLLMVCWLLLIASASITHAKAEADEESITGVSIDSINFPDDVIREYAAFFDVNKDGILSVEERGKATEVIISEQDGSDRITSDNIWTQKNITTYKGMELFHNLQSVYITAGMHKLSGDKNIDVSVLDNRILPYIKQVKKITVNIPNSPLDGPKNKHINWTIGNDMNCESLTISQIQFDAFAINSDKLKNLSLETCELPSSYWIETPNLESLAMNTVYAPALNYGTLNKLQSLSLMMHGYHNNAWVDSPITSIDLEKTKNITRLDIQRCKLKQINLKPVRATLKYLLVSQPNKSQLKDLNVNGLKEITEMHLNCGIRNLNVSKCSKLRYLDCNSFSLEKATLSKSLYYLFLGDESKKGVKKLDVSGCKKLKFISLYGFKRLKNLNLKKNTQLYSLTLTNSSFDKLTLPKSRSKHQLMNMSPTWAKVDWERMQYGSSETENNADAMEKATADYKILNATTVKTVDITSMTSIKKAKKTLKQGILSSKKVKKIVISKKMKASEKNYIRKLASKKKIKVKIK